MLSKMLRLWQQIISKKTMDIRFKLLNIIIFLENNNPISPNGYWQLVYFNLLFQFIKFTSSLPHTVTRFVIFTFYNTSQNWSRV